LLVDQNKYDYNYKKKLIAYLYQLRSPVILHNYCIANDDRNYCNNDWIYCACK
jgi:hypothetical protein